MNWISGFPDLSENMGGPGKKPRINNLGEQKFEELDIGVIDRFEKGVKSCMSQFFFFFIKKIIKHGNENFTFQHESMPFNSSMQLEIKKPKCNVNC